MATSIVFNGKVKRYTKENKFTILYSKYLKAILLYDELEDMQYENYEVNKKDINKSVLEKMIKIRDSQCKLTTTSKS